jgi:SOS-response transcriptional repressor LexA
MLERMANRAKLKAATPSKGVSGDRKGKDKTKEKKHYKNEAFLSALGLHCKALRLQGMYSIDRMAKESEQLSPSVIHRLETGSGAVTVSALFRYAEVLNVHPRELLDIELPVESLTREAAPPKVYALDDPKAAKLAYKTLLPYYSLKAAAGYFGNGEDVTQSGWVEVASEKRLEPGMFVARAVGRSMSPRIEDGDWLVFKANPSGTRQGKIVLAQARGISDPETGGAFTLKVYTSTKKSKPDGSWRHEQIRLSPLNPAYKPILLEASDENAFKIVGEYLFTL